MVVGGEWRCASGIGDGLVMALSSGAVMQGGQFRPLLVAGVAGGVGTSTWARCVRLGTGLPVEDVGVYQGGLVDVLVTSNTAAAASRLGTALAACPRPPLLVVMQVVPGAVAAARSYLRKADPHITARFDIPHQRKWCELDSPPGRQFPARVRDVVEALRRFPIALQQMYAMPVRSGVPPTHPVRHALEAGEVVAAAAGRTGRGWPPPAGQPGVQRRS